MRNAKDILLVLLLMIIDHHFLNEVNNDQKDYVHRRNLKPSDGLIPNPKSVVAFEEEVNREFALPFAKLAKAAIQTSIPLKAISNPHPILED
jgi:hypothetical protein